MRDVEYDLVAYKSALECLDKVYAELKQKSDECDRLVLQKYPHCTKVYQLILANPENDPLVNESLALSEVCNYIKSRIEWIRSHPKKVEGAEE